MAASQELETELLIRDPVAPEDLESDNLVDIVAVHGFGGDARTTWTSASPPQRKPVNWLVDDGMLPRQVPNARILRFGYKSTSNPKISTSSLDLVATTLLERLAVAREVCPRRPIIWIGYGIGGFIIQKAIVSADLPTMHNDIVSVTGGVLFFGIPNVSASSPNSASFAQMGILLPEIAENNRQVKETASDFTLLANTRSIPISNFVETYPTKAFGKNLMVASRRTPSGDGFARIGLSTSHANLAKFDSPQDRNFIKVTEILRNYVINAPSLARARLGVQVVYSAVRYSNGITTSQQDQEILQALFVIDLEPTLRYHAESLHIREAGSWILSNPEFTNWLNGPSSQILWLHGDKGRGKTFLATLVIKELRNILQLRNDAVLTPTGSAHRKQHLLTYFFCSTTNAQQNSAISILRTLLYQMLEQRPDLISSFSAEYRRRRPATSLADLLLSGDGLRDLWAILQELLKGVSVHTLYFVLDGLDECDQSRSDLLTLMQPYVAGVNDLVATRAVPLSNKIKFFVTSQNDPEILEQLNGARDISIELNSVGQDDFRRYVNSEVESISIERGYGPELKEELRSSILANADNNFLWARLVFDDLRMVQQTKSISILLSSLEKKTLEETYQQALAALSSHKSCLDLLGFMVVVNRPPTLDELAIIAGIPNETDSKDSESLLECIQKSSSFVGLQDDKVNFTNSTASAFIRNYIETEKSLEKIHAVVSRRCFKYVLQTSNWNTPSDLLQYPIEFWIDHARKSAAQDIHSVLNLDLDFYAQSSNLRQNWLDAYWNIKHSGEVKPSNFTLMHLAAESGFHQLAEKLVDHERVDSVNERDSLGNIPLHWAARGGYRDMAMILLLRTDDLDAVNFDEMTALNFTAVGGHLELAVILIAGGANVNSKASNATTVLQNAASNGHTEFVRLLLAEGADSEARNSDGKTAEELAKSKGYEEISRLLLDWDAGRIATSPLKFSQRIDGGFLGAVVDFLQPKSPRYFHKRVSVDRLLSEESFDDIMGVSEMKNKIESGPGNARRSLRWLHLPANNMRWVEILMAKHYKAKGQLQRVAAVLKPEVWAERQQKTREFSVRGRFIRPLYHEISFAEFGVPEEASSSKGSSFMIAMPYLNWATETERVKLNSIIDAVYVDRQSDNPLDEEAISVKIDRYEKLLWLYLFDEHPLHIRRTLDQSYYSTLQDTETRDTDQVPKKYLQQQFPEISIPPVLMVDQLWAWVLDENTVITSFPQRWTERKKDDIDPDNKTDLLDNILRDLDKNASDVSNASDLLEKIVQNCVNLSFDASLYQDGKLQFPQCYEICISLVADNESNLFREFSRDLAIETKKLAADSHFRINEKMFQIEAEARYLEFIKDVRDELNMILLILQDQKKTLENFEQRLRRSRISVHNQSEEILLLDKRAEKVYTALKDLLDLKQKQANVVEARSQRHQAEEAVKQGLETARQGKAILVFTIVTIIFLPLSFMASFFALQIIDFPALTLGFVLELMFPISAAIFLPCILLALNLDLFTSIFERLKSPLSKALQPRLVQRSGSTQDEEAPASPELDSSVTEKGSEPLARATTTSTLHGPSLEPVRRLKIP